MLTIALRLIVVETTSESERSLSVRLVIQIVNVLFTQQPQVVPVFFAIVLTFALVRPLSIFYHLSQLLSFVVHLINGRVGHVS